MQFQGGIYSITCEDMLGVESVLYAPFIKNCNGSIGTYQMHRLKKYHNTLPFDVNSMNSYGDKFSFSIL